MTDHVTQPLSFQPVNISTPVKFDIAREQGDDNNRTIPVSFASDAIVDDESFGPLQLSFADGAIDLRRARERGLPVHIMHERDLPCGRVENITLEQREGANRLVGTMRFSSSERGDALYRDAKTGIITDTSVGARILSVREHGSGHTEATLWAPYEVSLVDRGADNTVGVNRRVRGAPPNQSPAVTAGNRQSSAAENAGGEQSTEVSPTMTAETTTQADINSSAPLATTTPVAASTSGNSPADDLNIAKLAEYGHKRAPDLGIERLGQDYIAFGQPFDEFRTKVWGLLTERAAAQPAVAAPAEIGLTPKETQEFSICRASMAALTNDWSRAGFELEASKAVASSLKRQARGFFVPLEVQRTMSVGDTAVGGTLVGTDHRSDLFIENLKARSIALQAGARLLGGLTSNVEIPKLTGSATFYWLSENEGVTESDLSTGLVNLSPRTVAGAIPMTRRLLIQSSPDVEAMVRDDLMTGAALAIDAAVFEGDGVKEPLGVAIHGDTNQVAVSTDGTPTFAEVVGLEAAVDTDNALVGQMGYVSTPTVRGNMKVTSIDTGSGRFVCGPDNEVNGYPLYTSSQLATNRILFGNFNDVMIGTFGVLEIKPDEATYAASGALVLRVFQDADVAVRHGQSFAVGT